MQPKTKEEKVIISKIPYRKSWYLILETPGKWEVIARFYSEDMKDKYIEMCNKGK